MYILNSLNQKSLKRNNMWITFVLYLLTGIAGPNTITATKYENSCYVTITKENITYNFE